MALYNPTQVIVSRSASTSASPANIDAAIVSTALLAANSNRRGATIWNNSTSNLFIDFDASVAIDDYAVKIAANGYFELPFDYTGAISGIWDAADGKALVRELI